MEALYKMRQKFIFLWSVTISGKDLVNADDMFSAVHYGKGIKNAYPSVIEIDSQKTLLEGDTITNGLLRNMRESKEVYKTIKHEYVC